MFNRILSAAAFVACASGLLGQEPVLYKLEGVSASMISFTEPTLVGQSYVFMAWPENLRTTVPKDRVKKIIKLQRKAPDTVYQIEVYPSGNVLARDIPFLKNGAFQFHTWRSGTLMSIRQSDVRRIGALTGDQAFWAEQERMGEKSIGNMPMEGTNSVVSIGTPQDSSQAGPGSMSSLGPGGQNDQGISGAPPGNWLYEGTPGVSDAWSPANARMDNGVPTLPAATDGRDAPRP